MEQATCAEPAYASKKRTTRQEKCLARVETLLPRERLAARIRTVYPPAVMLRVHGVQRFDNWSGPGMEDLLDEVELVRGFAGLRRSGPWPDETAILHFHHQPARAAAGLRQPDDRRVAPRGRLTAGEPARRAAVDPDRAAQASAQGVPGPRRAWRSPV